MQHLPKWHELLIAWWLCSKSRKWRSGVESFRMYLYHFLWSKLVPRSARFSGGGGRGGGCRRGALTYLPLVWGVAWTYRAREGPQLDLEPERASLKKGNLCWTLKDGEDFIRENSENKIQKEGNNRDMKEWICLDKSFVLWSYKW